MTLFRVVNKKSNDNMMRPARFRQQSLWNSSASEKRPRDWYIHSLDRHEYSARFAPLITSIRASHAARRYFGCQGLINGLGKLNGLQPRATVRNQ